VVVLPGIGSVYVPGDMFPAGISYCAAATVVNNMATIKSKIDFMSRNIYYQVSVNN
jgi:hypothetical protein